jgi:hypothetical protein
MNCKNIVDNKENILENVILYSIDSQKLALLGLKID